MNRFQAMAMIMEILSVDSGLKSNTLEYMLARKIVSRKIDVLGPDLSLEQARKLKAKFLKQDRVEEVLDDIKEKSPHLDFSKKIGV